LEKIEQNTASNIINIKILYKNAQSLFNENKIGDAIEQLGGITRTTDKWYTFTEAYMNLIKWIRLNNYNNTIEKLIIDCQNFLTWYIKRLQIGITRIELDQGKLDEIDKDEFQTIKEEQAKAEEHLKALKKRTPLSKKDEEYEDLVTLLIEIRKKLLMLKDHQESPEEQLQDVTIQLITLHKGKNKNYDKLLKTAQEIMGEKLYERHKHTNYSEEIMKEEAKHAYYLLSEIITNIENFDTYQSCKGNKLATLTTHLEKEIEKKINHWLR